MLKCRWEAQCPDIKNVINEAGFETFFELCWTMIPMNIRTSNCFLPCQSDSGILLALFIFQVLVK